MVSFSTRPALRNVEAAYFCEAGKVVFNATQATRFGNKTSSSPDSGDVSFFFGKVFWWIARQMTGPTGFFFNTALSCGADFLIIKDKI
jgi:glycerol uptake facilitator-like aquaporin